MKTVSLLATPSLALAAVMLVGACAKTRPLSPNDVVAEHAMVASAHPVASAVGLEILKKGGNAVDAAVAMALALSMAEPNASGLGGGGFMVIKLEGAPDAAMIDYREAAPGRATPEYYYGPGADFDKWTEEGPNAVGVPGLIAGAGLALEKFGTMTLADVLQPAIRLAREGVTVGPKLNGMIVDNVEKLQKFPAAALLYLPEGLPLEPGTLLKNGDLAATLEKIAASGPSAFYEGEVAAAIGGEVTKLGGPLEAADLKGYRAKLRAPVRGTYRGYEIISASPPTGGGTHLIELLNILEGYDVRRFGHNTAAYLHVLAEAMKMVFADKAANSGDPDFVKVPVATLTSKEHARELRERIEQGRARFDYKAPDYIVPDAPSTSHLSVVDARGNVAALTQSINSFFGSGIVAPGTGVLLNNHLADFDSRPGRPNSIAPGRRPTSSIAPTIVLKGGRPFMTLGTPGATRIVSALAQIIMNVVDFGMPMDDAIEAPRIHALGKTLHAEGRIPADVIEALKALGHTVKTYPDFDNYFGGAQGILIDARARRLTGGADSRRDGVAMGY